MSPEPTDKGVTAVHGLIALALICATVVALAWIFAGGC